MDHEIMNKIIQDLERGRNSVHHMRDLLMNQRPGSNATADRHDHDDDQEFYKGLDDESMVALTALDSALSILHSSDHFSLEDNKVRNSESQDDSARDTPRKDKRGCYKRRRHGESMVSETSNLRDDGFAWRKYGQKVILYAKHPRNYYRCTHKTDQGCEATKQVQQISEDPTKYRTIYHGKHTCKLNHPKITHPIFTTQDNSSVYLNFQNPPPPKQALNPPNISFSSGSAMVKQECGPIKEETQSEPSVHHSSPSSPYPAATTTPRSEISSAEVYSSGGSPYRMDVGEDYYSHLMGADSIDLDFLQSLLNVS